MATLPRVDSPRPAPRPSRGIASVRDADAVGKAVQGLGDTLNVVGLQAIDREATAAAKEADVLASEQIRKLLYDPETGFANKSGGDAVNSRQAMLERLDALPDSLISGLSKPAQKKARDALLARVERAKQTIDTHTSAERRTWINGASAARVESAYQDSLLNPLETDNSLRIIESEIRGTALREGWSSDQTELKLTQERSRVYRDQALRIAAVDPSQAAEFLSQNRDKMLGSDAVDLELKLVPLAKEYEGRKLGDAAFYGALTVPDGFDWSKHRSGGGLRADAIDGLDDKFEGSLASLIASAPPEIRDGLKVFSGYRSVEKQRELWENSDKTGKWVARPGSSFHNHGQAVDLEWNGKRLDKAPAEVVEWVHKNAASFGLHFPMAHEPWHAEPLGTRGTQPVQVASGGIDSLLDIEDPKRRAAAIDQFNLRSAAADGQRKAAVAAVEARALEIVVDGGSVTDLPVDEQVLLGREAVSGLMGLQRSLASGVQVETDPAIYLMLKELQAGDPERFKMTNMLAYSNVLSGGDLKQMIDAQTKPRDPANEIAVSTLMSVAANQMQAVGIDTKPSAKEADLKRVAAIQTELIRWQETVIAETGKAPTASQIDARVAQALLPVVINPGAFRFNVTGMAFEASTFKVDEAGMTSGTVTIGDTTVPPAVVQEQIDMLRASGKPITAGAVISRLVALMGN